MKKHNPPPSRMDSKSRHPANVDSRTAAALNDILKDAYRRHSRGRLARAAMTACLGR